MCKAVEQQHSNKKTPGLCGRHPEGIVGISATTALSMSVAVRFAVAGPVV
jgi:hypothetical protein